MKYMNHNMNKLENLLTTIWAVFSTINRLNTIRGRSLTACNAAPPSKFQIAAIGPQNGRPGLEKCLPLGFWALPSPVNFGSISFLIRALLLSEK